MNANEIDELLKASKDANMEKMLELLGVWPIYGNVDRFFGKYQKELPKKIMAKIEEGDFEYFLSKIDDDSYKYECLDLLSYSTKKDGIKRIIEEQKTNIDRTDSSNMIGLIKATEDPGYMKSIVERIVYKKEKDWKFSSLGLLEIMTAINDPEYIEEILEDKNKLFDEFKIINKDYIERLVIATGDTEYIKSIIEDKNKQKEFCFSQKNLHGLINATGDTEYIKSIIEDREKREEYSLYNEHLRDAVIATRDINYIDAIISDKQKRKEYGFEDYYNLKRMIIDFGDINYIKSIIENKEKYKELGFDKLDIIDLILSTEDAEYIKNILSDADKQEELRLNENEKALLITETNDIDYINEFLSEKESGFQGKEVSGIIETPENMTIGIEIECEGNNSKTIENLSNIIAEGWICKQDGSLESGIEVTSPILTGDNQKTTEQIKKVCRRLQVLRTKCIRKMWRTYTYRLKLFNYA